MMMRGGITFLFTHITFLTSSSRLKLSKEECIPKHSSKRFRTKVKPIKIGIRTSSSSWGKSFISFLKRESIDLCLSWNWFWSFEAFEIPIWIAHNHRTMVLKNHFRMYNTRGAFTSRAKGRMKARYSRRYYEGKQTGRTSGGRLGSICSVLGPFGPSTNVLANTTRPRHDGRPENLTFSFGFLCSAFHRSARA